MTENGKLQGCVITSYEHRSHGVVELLAARLRNRLELIHYAHPYSINTARPFRFVIVLSLDDLAGVVRRFRAKDVPLPLIIHIDRPHVIRGFNYAEHFPYIEIAPVEQADLHEKDITLKLTLFQEIIEFLEARA